jgi:hypothetical protein
VVVDPVAVPPPLLQAARRAPRLTPPTPVIRDRREIGDPELLVMTAPLLVVTVGRIR